MSNTQTITVPDIGDFKDIEIIEILVAPGDEVKAEDPIITLESDKAAMDVPAPFGGRIESLAVELGGRVSEGDTIGTMVADEGADKATNEAASAPASSEPKAADEASGQAASPPPAASQAATAPPAEPATPDPGRQAPVTLPPPATKTGAGNPHATPAVRRFARELGVDITQVEGSGRKSRILKSDVQNFVKQALAQPAAAAATGNALPALPQIDFSPFGDTESLPLGRIKKLSGKHLHACWVNIPHVTQNEDADITGLEAFRQEAKGDAKAQGYNLTILPFVMKAVVVALKAYPSFNASLDASGENLILKKYFNIGIAVDTPNGLVVPVVKNVDSKSVMALAGELAGIGVKAREGKLRPDDMQGASFSISSLGGIGGKYFTPIINAPEVAILGLSRSAMQPVWNGKEFEPRLMLPLSLSYDHRVIDGAEGARFITHLSKVLGDIRRLVL